MSESEVPTAAHSVDVSADASPGHEIEPDVAKIHTLDDLLAYAYQKAGKRLGIGAKTFRTLTAGTAPDFGTPEQHRALLRRLAAGDSLLAVPPRLLVNIEEVGVRGPLRRALLQVVRIALEQHPLFSGKLLREALDGPPPDRDEVFKALRSASMQIGLSVAGVGGTSMKPAERKKLLSNASVALLLLLAARDRWTLDEIIRCLSTYVWPDQVGSRSTNPGAVLVDPRSAPALAIAVSHFGTQVRSERARVEELEVQAQAAEDRIAEAAAVTEDQERRLAAQSEAFRDLHGRLAAIDAALTEEKHGRVVDRSHFVDDYEAMRTRLTRMLNRQIELLTDGIHALQNGRSTVTEEYLERAVHTLKTDLDQLRKDGAT